MSVGCVLAQLNIRRTLSLLEALELALACEMPTRTSFTLLELCVYVWDIQSRPCYKQRLSSVHEIHRTLLEFMEENPRKVVPLMPELYVNQYF
ncbi:MAG: hypothetical protein ACTSRW_00270 [Candidatus Helarchaeota archaeon]